MKMSSIIVPQGMRRVLLHACCAPCSSAIVEWLCAHEIEPIIFYFNPNIYPQEEYEIRKAESKRHAESLGIRWIDGDAPHPGPPLKSRVESLKSRVESQESRVESQESRVERCYNQAHAEWLEAMRGLENEPERGSRCARCFYYRMLATAKKAQELGIPFFATTLASSRWKNLEQINAAGEKAAKDVGCKMLDVHFWAQNWRKDGLQERRNALLKEYAFYNQQYCGCEFSMHSTK